MVVCGLIGWRSGDAAPWSSAPGAAWVSAVRAVVAMWAAPSGPSGSAGLVGGRLWRSVLNVGIYEAALRDREREDHDEEHERLSAGQAKERAAEGGVVNLHHGGEGATQRPALRALHQIDLVEDLERADGAERDHQEGRRAQERQRDMAE